MTTAKKKTKSDSFEEALKNLEKVVADLEEGKLSLEDSIKAFERGTKLAKICENKLNVARKKVEVLMGDEVKTLEWDDTNELDVD